MATQPQPKLTVGQVLIALAVLAFIIVMLVQNWNLMFPPCHNAGGCVGPGA